MSSPSKKLPQLSQEKLERLQARLREEGLQGSDAERIGPRPAGAPAPLSYAQERLLFLGRMVPESPVFNIAAGFHLEGPLDRALVSRALAFLVDRHESLRTRFAVNDERAEVVVDPPLEPVLRDVDLTGLDEDAREAEALRLGKEQARVPFDLAAGPLVRFTLYRLGPEHHLLLLVVHHIVSEVQSIGIFARELAQVYAALAAGQEPRLPQLAIQFADFAHWQRERMRGEAYQSQLAYWTKELADAPAMLELPTDRPRPAVQGFEGGTRTREIAPATAARVRALCKAERLTLFAPFLAAYGALLSRYSGQDDVLIGVPMTDRNRSELVGLMGFFVNTLVLRCEPDAKTSFRALLRRTQERMLAAQANQELPFEHLVDALAPERDLSRSPLFQVAFLVQYSEEAARERFDLGGGLTMRPVDDPLALHTETSKFDLALVVWADGGSLRVSFEYNADLFDAETIDRMLGHLETLLASALDDPDAAVAALPILTEEERRQQATWNDTAAELPEGVLVHELFERWAERQPDALAVAAGGRELSYRELDRRANRLAHRLRELGVGPDVLVAICTSRSVEMVVGILATLKAGGAYVPLDLAYPAERLAFMLEDADTPVVLSESSCRDLLPEHEGHTLFLDEEQPQGSDAPPRVATLPSSLAYVIYTSGSTGVPKGVGIEHTGLLNLLTWHQREYDVTPADRATHLAGLAFDASVWELWPYLCGGASLHLAAEDVRLSPPRVLDWLARERITLSFLPTPLAEAVLREPMPETMDLRAMLTGGDKLHHAPSEELPFRLVNHYGPTENTVVATFCEVPPVLAPSGPSGNGSAGAPAPPIGRPISNVEVQLLGPGRQPVPVGVPGELFIGGRSLARGYHGRDELTAEKFVPHPLRPDAARDGARMYATGDLARYRPDGQIEFLGRLDGQVKIRGFRIELGEIETRLGDHPAVAECAVLVVEGPLGANELVGYVVATQPGVATAQDLRVHLREQCPEYMVPAAFVFLDEMPLTPNGKLDRRALPKPDLSRSERTFTRPEGELEVLIAGVWGEVLGRDEIDADTNFFDMGGHSLLMAKIHVKLQEALGRDVSVVELFQFPTVGSLATHLGNQGRSSTALSESSERAASRRQALIQRRRAKR